MSAQAQLSLSGSTAYRTVLADPPWRFENRSGKVAPEHLRLHRYRTMSMDEIAALPVADLVDVNAHLYLWIPNALMEDGFRIMRAWGFTYKAALQWLKVRADGQPDMRCMGFYFRNVTETLLFGIRGDARTLPPARSLPNLIVSRKREHSRKPDEQYDLVEQASPGPFLELFARHARPGWAQWGDQLTAIPGPHDGHRPDRAAPDQSERGGDPGTSERRAATVPPTSTWQGSTRLQVTAARRLAPSTDTERDTPDRG